MINDRNWQALLIATLRRARDQCPSGPFTDEELATLEPVQRSQAELGTNIDDILNEQEERDEG